jgi:hypothetical protein
MGSSVPSELFNFQLKTPASFSMDSVWNRGLEFAPIWYSADSLGGKMSHLFQSSVFLVVALVLFCILLIPAILYILTIQKALNKCAETSRTISPGSVWLLLVPLLNLIWHFLVVFGVARSLGNEFARRGIPNPDPLPGQTIGLAMCICACCSIIPILGVLASLASLVLWIMYWIKIADYSRMLGEAPPAIATVPSV